MFNIKYYIITKNMRYVSQATPRCIEYTMQQEDAYTFDTLEEGCAFVTKYGIKNVDVISGYRLNLIENGMVL